MPCKLSGLRPATDCSLSLTTVWLEACQKNAIDLGLGGCFTWVLRFPMKHN